MLYERLKAANADVWHSYTHHDFVAGLADGTLQQRCFQHYLVQDYLFLIQFARAYALAIYKGRSLADMRNALGGLKAILDVELDLHVRLCGEWGLTPEQVEQAPESRATIAYTRYVLETGMRGDILDLYVALAPCVVGYAEIAERISANGFATTDDNPYAVWVREYAGADYRGISDAAIKNLDELAVHVMTESRFDDLCRIFGEATRMEADFWQMGLDLAD